MPSPASLALSCAKIDHDPDHEHNHHEWCPRLDRRAALRLLGLTTLATVAGCGSSGTASTSTAEAASSKTATTTTLTASSTTPAESATVTLTATVSPSAATGTVTFYTGSTTLGTGSLGSGAATLSTSFSASGAQSLTATYAGSTTYVESTSSALSITVGTGTTASCGTESIEGEEGPYFVDDSASGYLRGNIVSNLDGTETQTGVPLALTIYVFDANNSCAAMQSVQVDIWSCNANGVYSAESSESTVGQSWLRGYQITDANGKVEFTTIIPGWYSGRTNHIHLRLRSTYDETDTSGSNTMQLFFDQTLIDTLATSVAPYSTEGTNPTTNSSDHVYTPEEKGTTLLTLSGSTTAGYSASFNIYLPIESAT